MANVPQEYESYINTINGSGFNFKKYPISYTSGTLQPIVETNIENMSWVVGKNYARWDKIYPSTPITVKLTGDTTHITVTYEGYSNSAYTKCSDYYRIMYNDKSYDSQSSQNILLGDNVYSAYYGMNYYSVANFTTDFAINNADNIKQALVYLTSRFKNIVIYVNDVKWSDPFTPTTATVRVTCDIPKDPDYKYIKLTYKKDTRPDSWEDGASIDITKNARTIDIPSLDIGYTYWFTIFTDINESEAVPFTIV